MKRSSLSNAVAVATLAVTLLTGCDDDHSFGPPVGVNCKVQFRRDALGAASPNPVSPMTDSHNGAITSMVGKIKSVNKEWLVLDAHGPVREQSGEIWIPKAAILLILIESE